MSSFVSRWVVAQRHQIGEGDVSPDGVLGDAVRDELIALEHGARHTN